MRASDTDIYKTIRQYGDDILCSEQFGETRNTKHHRHSSVSDHSLNVCIMSLELARLLKAAGVSVDDDDLVTAALCHDLGMVDRKNKYHGLLNSWYRHPENSVAAAHDIKPDLSANAESMIRSHMWPLSSYMPRSRESVILVAADKCASLIDWGEYFTGKHFKKDIKKRLAKASSTEPLAKGSQAEV